MESFAVNYSNGKLKRAFLLASFTLLTCKAYKYMTTVLLYSNYLKIQIYNTETKVTLVALAYSRAHTHTHMHYARLLIIHLETSKEPLES